MIMYRALVVGAVALPASMTLRVEAQQSGFGSELVKKAAWTVRLDAAANPASVTVSETGTDIAVASPAGAIVWRSADRATRDFTVRATVRLRDGSRGGAGLFSPAGISKEWIATMPPAW
jgi:hypothetical protein